MLLLLLGSTEEDGGGICLGGRREGGTDNFRGVVFDVPRPMRLDPP